MRACESFLWMAFTLPVKYKEALSGESTNKQRKALQDLGVGGECVCVCVCYKTGLDEDIKYIGRMKGKACHDINDKFLLLFGLFGDFVCVFV